MMTVASAAAQVTPTPGQQRMLEKVALAKARVGVYQWVRALPLGAGLTVGRWLDTDRERERALRLWTRELPREGRSRLYSDAVCEADVCVAPEQVRDALLRIMRDGSKTGGVDSNGIRRAARRWRTICATGRAALAKGVRPGRPPGWEDVTADGIEQARAAATTDAHAALLARVERLELTGNRKLGGFLDSSPAVRSAVADALERAAAIEVELAPDQVAMAEVRVGMRDLLRILTSVQQELYRGDEFAAADFRQMYLQLGQVELVATGLATPPSDARSQAVRQAMELDVPEWASKTLSATGRYVLADDESPTAAALREAARLDGAARLYEQISQLIIREPVSVAEFLGYHQQLKDDVALFVSGARPVGPLKRDAGGVGLEVELPLRRLWEILRRGMTREEVLPPADKDPTQSPLSPAGRGRARGAAPRDSTLPQPLPGREGGGGVADKESP